MTQYVIAESLAVLHLTVSGEIPMHLTPGTVSYDGIPGILGSAAGRSHRIVTGTSLRYSTAVRKSTPGGICLQHYSPAIEVPIPTWWDTGVDLERDIVVDPSGGDEQVRKTLASTQNISVMMYNSLQHTKSSNIRLTVPVRKFVFCSL